MVIFLCLLVAQLFIAGESNKLQRIVNGQLAEEGQFPYLVGLQITYYIPYYKPLKTVWCGGSIIADEWILTAAHCAEGWLPRVKIFYGSNQLANEENQSEGKIYRHPKYRKNGYFHYDIALIQTPRLEFNDRIQSIPLPSPRDGRSIKPGQSVIAAGWGTEYIGGPNLNYLNWVELEIAHESECKRTYGFGLKGQLCVRTHEIKSTCEGDSGGPLVLKDENKLIGITSFGLDNGCNNGAPVVFTDVIEYLDWIESVSRVKPN